MSGGWTGQNVLLGNTNQAIAGIVTAQVISKEFAITHGGATEAFRIDLTCSAAAVTGSITVALQTKVNGSWVTNSYFVDTVANGETSSLITMHNSVLADAAELPLTDRGRIVVTTTHADDEITVTALKVYQEL